MAIDKRIDVHWVKHDGNVVLIMTPLVARLIVDMVGSIGYEGDGPEIRDIVRPYSDVLWEEYREKIGPLEHGDYWFLGDLRLSDEGKEALS